VDIQVRVDRAGEKLRTTRSTPITQPGGMMGHHTDLDAESS